MSRRPQTFEPLDDQSIMEILAPLDLIFHPLINEILEELGRARAKFPGDNVTLAALVEEVGELAKAMIDESRENVRKEAIQVAVMAMRVVLDGDYTLNEWRKRKGLDSLIIRGAE